MEKVYRAIDKLIIYAQNCLSLKSRNVDFVRGSIYHLLELNGNAERLTGEVADLNCDSLLDEFKAAAVEEGLFKDYEGDHYADLVMGELSLMPDEIERKFYEIEKERGSEAATEWLYNYSVYSDYVKKSKLDENIRFDEGRLTITINKAKPEFRDPKKAAQGNAVGGGYPKCSICHENEGYAGRDRRTLRTVDIELGGQNWFWQFSPYGYFYQHGIAVNYEHTPMHIDKSTFSRLMDFVDRFPHYFIGCNAPLERIGGSVLAHDHYQGGGEILPMHRAKAAHMLGLKGFSAKIEVLDWSGTVVRIVSKDRREIEEISELIRKKWVDYTDTEKGIVACDKLGEHNAISPTVIKGERGYEMSIILRSNITSEAYPDGVFHAHPEFHIIKKESIGLIEAQGLFILPGRLESELAEVGKCVLGGKLKEELKDFQIVFDELSKLMNGRSSGDIQGAMREELGSICERILENTAVFKDKEDTVKFLMEMGCERC